MVNKNLIYIIFVLFIFQNFLYSKNISQRIELLKNEELQFMKVAPYFEPNKGEFYDEYRHCKNKSSP